MSRRKIWNKYNFQSKNEFVLFRHGADTKENGQQEREKEWTGGPESYSLTEKNGVTTLIIKTDVPQEQEETFNIRVPRALERIKTLAGKMQKESNTNEWKRNMTL